jgi:hypothetical protein
MDRDRVVAELPPDMRRWLSGADARTWGHVARDAAARVAARLLGDGGEAAWSGPAHRLLLADPSPAVRAVAADLGSDPTTVLPWTRGAVAAAACEWFGLHGAGAWRDVSGRAADFLRRRVPSAPAAAPSR